MIRTDALTYFRRLRLRQCCAARVYAAHNVTIAITLDGPGAATFNSIRVRQTHLRGQYDGHFLSNDEELNRAWYASAYAVDLSTVRDTRKNPNRRMGHRRRTEA